MASNDTVELKELIRKRGNLKSKVTYFEKFLKPIHDSYNSNQVISMKDMKQLEIRVAKLNKTYDEFDKLQTQIETICEDDSLDEHYTEREEFESCHSSSLAIAQIILSGVATNNNATTTIPPLDNIFPESDRPGSAASICSSTNTGNIVEKCHNSLNNLQGIRLPTIDLPKFKGNHTNWLEYKDTFQSLIHLNETITNIQKYHYLRASLDGDALKIIQSLEFTSSNYFLAWELLCKRYDNPRLLIHNHVKSIFDLEILNRESAKGLRNLIDNLNKHLRSLNTLGQPTNHWDTLLIYMVSSKLDKITAKEWEKYKIAKTIPTWEDMTTFLNSRADLLETLEFNLGIKTKEHVKNVVAFTAHFQCLICDGTHKIYKCEEFLKSSIKERLAKVKELKLCQNCLGRGHFVKNCKSGHCQKCKQKHNTLLHQNSSPEITMSCVNVSQLVLLSTAGVNVCDAKGNYHRIRALLDSGSQSCFMSKKLQHFLGTEVTRINMSVMGINKGLSNIDSKSDIQISSSNNQFTDIITCLVVPHVTDNLPTINFDISQWKIPKNIQLADPSFNESHAINLLIGASHFWKILKSERIKLGSGLPLLQNTVFGYIVSGSLDLPTETSICNLAKGQLTDLKQFWEIEEVDVERNISLDDVECEKHFVENLSRDETGRFIVRLPLKYPTSHLGNSREKALRRFYNMEKKLNNNTELRKEYSKFMSEYISLGHMSPSTEVSQPCYFLPHHSVVKQDSLTTKRRVVFDGSSVTDSGWSLNDIQHTGPAILNDLIPILLRFREHNIIVCSDIEKMFRQILINEQDRCLQQIFWRSNSNDPVTVFKLNTVTYGTRSAPYLSVRCLNQLATDHIDKYSNTQSYLLQTFVGNRVSQIQQLTCPEQWHHVSSASNPADIASRGILPEALINSQLWWHGPDWLSAHELELNKKSVPVSITEIPEMRKVVVSHVCTAINIFKLDTYSNLSRLKNVATYTLRFISNCRLPKEQRSRDSLTTKELSDGLALIIKLAQTQTFAHEIKTLQEGTHTKTKLASLCPFLDEKGILRVGGRLKNSELRLNSKHPILLKGKHHLTKLIFQHYHNVYCHAPPQLLLSIVRQNYWPTSGMTVAKDIVRKCVKCFRFKPTINNPIMSDLPRERVTISNPFHITGVDYAGPFLLLDKKGRGSKTIKSYVSLFICFVTKAIHLELITDLTTENFISALRRFTSRKGKPLKMYSDQGTNFIGAKRELSSLEEFLSNSKTKISNYCSNEGISWNFNPPRSPHFGGLWEANIKQFKYHLLRVIGNTKLTYEEFQTVVIQIEGLLNSRPLIPMSSDPNDLLPLTPSHFLIGKPLTTIPDPSLKDVSLSRLSRYQLLQKLYQDFWKSWSRDYLHTLQQRSKWREQSENIKIGTLVIMKEENSPSRSWPMGRIVATHPGSDGVVRVVDVKTVNGIFRRAVAKLCPLPIDDKPLPEAVDC